MKRIVVLLGIVSFLVFTGCGNSNTPSSAVRKFFTAIEKKDTKAMEQVATTETVQLVTMLGEKSQGMITAYGKITNTAEEIDGDTATVTVTFESGNTEDFDLVKVDGKWKIAINK
jgi:ketosteroid isomerase-like protein